MPNIASRFPKEFHWNKTFLMDKVVPPTVKCLICPTGVEKKTFFPKFIEKKLTSRQTHMCLWNDFCVSGSKDSRFVHLFKHPFEQLMFEVV